MWTCFISLHCFKSPLWKRGNCPCPSENCVACKSLKYNSHSPKLYRHVELLTIMCRCAPEVLFLDTLIKTELYNPLRISVQYIYHVIFCCAQLKMYESHNHETLQVCWPSCVYKCAPEGVFMSMPIKQKLWPLFQ